MGDCTIDEPVCVNMALINCFGNHQVDAAFDHHSEDTGMLIPDLVYFLRVSTYKLRPHMNDMLPHDALATSSSFYYVQRVLCLRFSHREFRLTDSWILRYVKEKIRK